jgi:hypothetical protein
MRPCLRTEALRCAGRLGVPAIAIASVFLPVRQAGTPTNRRLRSTLAKNAISITFFSINANCLHLLKVNIENT